MIPEDFFCPAPWTGIYYHENNIGPCHASTKLQKMSPTEYLNSDWLKNIKSELKEGKIPVNCSVCYNKERRGLKSTRQASCIGMGKDPVKFPNDKVDPTKFLVDDPIALDRIELRVSNLCNFKCRMCNQDSSSEWQREIEEYPEIQPWTGISKSQHIANTSDYNFEELKKISLDNIRVVCFTGGEPLLIKQYYDFMDHMIETGANEKTMLELYSNCSVWNPLFIDRLLKFKRARFVMSIDGVDKVAEYNRKGDRKSVV
jgi:sulfatase maturation enzyme AslB (radical SAM superfamily)